MRATPCLILLSLCLAIAARAEEATLILTNGKILTVDPDFTTVEALAVKDNRILATGSTEEMLKLAGPGTEQVDLGGKTVMPGLIDSHTHSTGASVFEYDHEIPGMETIADVLDYIRARAEVVPEGEWIGLSQVFITRLREGRFPTRKELDEAAPKHPVVFRTGPDAAVNSMALELSGIDRDFKVPEGSASRVERDPKTGEPTGIIRSGGSLIKSKSSSKSAEFEERLDRLEALLRDYNRWGITGICDRGNSDSSIRLYETLKTRDRLTVRTYLYYTVGSSAPIEDIQERVAKVAEHPLREKNPWLWLNGIKIFLDGGMLTGSAYMLEPWGVSESYGITEADYRGVVYAEPEKLYQIARTVMESGLQITAHSVGDGAVERLTEAYAQVAEKDFPVREKRPCVTHCNFMSRHAIDLMKKYGIVADQQPAWLYLDGATLTGHFGDERLTWFQPYHTLFEEGVIVGGGSDHMQKIGSLRSVNPYNPFLGIWTTLTRQPRWMDEPLHPEQRINREQAIRFYTINNAFISFTEDQRGSLEKGKLADFIILDRDILTCPVDEVRDIQVLKTWVDGNVVWEKED